MSNLILKNSKNGKSVFANKEFLKGEKIIDFKGDIFTRNQLPLPYDSVKDRYMQIDLDLYMGPSEDFDDYFNHSCSPNSGVIFNQNKIFLIAIKKINKGEEITWDYSTTMNEDDWEMECNCENINCRKIIKDFKYLPKEKQKEYIKLNIVPKYVLEKI